MMKNPEAALVLAALTPNIMAIFLGYNFNEFPVTIELCNQTFALMKKYRATFYDAAYHAVALLTKGYYAYRRRVFLEKNW